VDNLLSSLSERKKPNILFIMSDDHAAHAMSCYGSKINQTPNIDRIAKEGMRFNHCFCTNSICAPSRAVILSGTYSHINGVKTLDDNLDGRQLTFPQIMQSSGYQTALIGKWHLGHGEPHDPTGFDYWNILPSQGIYHDPSLIEMGERKKYEGYVTNIITDLSIRWLKDRQKDKPFLLMCHHKAPHGPWQPDEKHKMMYNEIDIPEPGTFYDDYQNRGNAAAMAKITIEQDMPERAFKGKPPEGLTALETKRWKYQRFIKDYLRCIASVDDNVGRLLDYLEEDNIAEDTIVIYTSDQGFFLGDHGWYDKRFMYEESLRMPLLVRYPREIKPGSIAEEMALNLDFAPTFLDYTGSPIPEMMQGNSLRSLIQGITPENWQTSMYYRYWMHLAQHNIPGHYGVRTKKYKLIYYYGEALGATGAIDESTAPEWELFDLEKDPYELNNVYSMPEYSKIVFTLKEELERLRVKYDDRR
jgi:arylsulfatase A-like enzyme